MKTLDQYASISTDVLSREIDGETVLLDLRGEGYFGLDRVGTRVWQLLGEDGRLPRVFERLRDEFDVEPERLAEDLNQLMSDLAAAGLITLEPSARSAERG